MGNYSKRVPMICDVCGNDEFKYDSKYNYEEMPNDAIVVCADCGKRYTKEQLLAENQGLISENVNDIVNNVLNDLEKDLKKAFK